MQPQSLDPQIVNYLKATRTVESGGNFQAQGKSGEYGAYQFTEPTWNSAAKKFGVNVPLKNATPEQQNEVAYKVASQWKQEHPDWNIGNFASAWNAGEGNADAYQKNHAGVNEFGVKYNTPAYAQKVAEEYQKIKGQSDISGYAAPNPITPIDLGQQNQQDQNTSPTLGNNLQSRLQDAGTGLNSIIGGRPGSGQSRLSGALQLTGAVAGGIGDIINSGLELIPGVKALEGLIGQGTGALAKTPIGQSVSKAIQSFSDAHPELSKDIGAGFNIITAIPILKGLGVAGSVAKDALSSSLQGFAEKSVQNGLEGAIGKAGLRGAKFLADNPTLAKDMVEERALPAVSLGKYNSLSALKASQSRIADLSEQVQKELNSSQFAIMVHDTTPIVDTAVQAFPHSDFTPEDLLGNAKNLTPQNSKLWTKFAKGEANLKEINLLRSDLDNAVKSVYTSTNEPPIKKEMGASLAGAMRKYVQTTADATQGPFAAITKEYRIQKALGYLHNKSVSSGLVGAGEKAGATIAGEAIGATHGMPLVGGFIGRQLGEGVSKRIAGIPEAILERTGKNAVRTSLKKLTKKTALGAIGALAQKTTR